MITLHASMQSTRNIDNGITYMYIQRLQGTESLRPKALSCMPSLWLVLVLSPHSACDLPHKDGVAP